MFQEHIRNILKVKNDILNFSRPIKNINYLELEIYLNNKYNIYIKKFADIFIPDKEITEDMQYFADIRPLSKYNENIISGWLIEDFFIYIFNLEIFKAHNFHFKLDNHDADRIIKKERTYINSDPDFTILHKDNTFKIEIQALLIKYNKFHIKKNKADRLLNIHSFLLSFLLQENKIAYFYPLDIEQFGKLTQIKAFGGKIGYEYFISALPNNKFITQSSFLEKLVLLLYWFYYHKNLSSKEFIKFQNDIKENYKTVTSILNYLKGNKQ